MTGHTTPLRRGVAAALLVPALLAGAACSGSDDPADEETPEEILAAAKTTLDDTAGVELELSTEALPEGIDGLVSATGVATHSPAFEGDTELIVSDLTVKVPVVAVDGLVYAQLPFTTGFRDIDPAEYGAPDPAQLMSPETGISTWLTEATDVEEGEQVREGEVVLTTYTGTLAGEVVHQSIPSAVEDSEFAVTFRLDEDDTLRTAEVTGAFYDEGTEVEYVIDFTEYDVDQEITRP
jgi:lipoprotein LprG